MNKFFNLILLSLLAFLAGGCNLSQSAAPNNLNAAAAKPTVAPTTNANAAAPNENSSPAAVNAAKSTDDGDTGDIKTCSPEKLYRGEILTVALKQPHGNYLAIRRMSDTRWFFLNDAERSQPVWNRAEFKMLSEIKINPETAVNATNNPETPEKIFNRPGKYRVMVSDEDFGQDDPPVTGICEVEYFHQKRQKQ